MEHLERVEGVVVSGEYDQNNVYKLVCAGFGMRGEHEDTFPAIKHISPGQVPLFQDLLVDEVGKQIQFMFDASGIIFVLNAELVPLLTNSLPSTLANKVALFSSIFGMEPKTFIASCRYLTSQIDPNNAEALALEVASYLKNVLLDSYIFGPWMMYIKGCK